MDIVDRVLIFIIFFGLLFIMVMRDININDRINKIEQQIIPKEETKQSSYSVSNEEFSPYLIGIFERGI